jgi:hypothetical protein
MFQQAVVYYRQTNCVTTICITSLLYCHLEHEDDNNDNDSEDDK